MDCPHEMLLCNSKGFESVHCADNHRFTKNNGSSDTKNLQGLIIKLIQGKQPHPDIFIIVIKLIQGK